MGPRLARILPLFALAFAMVGCGDHIAASDSLEAKLKDANAHANDGTSVHREHSTREADAAPRA